ncbi:MAG: hypothetical protein ACRDOB_27795 [Streptosporangiaceae bacterium]
MRFFTELAQERSRDSVELAERMRPARRLATLRRARRRQARAEHRMVEAWRRTAELRTAMDLADY